MIPSTKQIASRIFDFPEPFSPVMALKDSSNPGMVSFSYSKGTGELTSDGRSDWVRLEAYTISFSSGVVILGTHRPGLAPQSSSWGSLSRRFILCCRDALDAFPSLYQMRETSGGIVGLDSQKYMMSNVARNQTRVYATRLLSYVTLAFFQVTAQSAKRGHTSS